MYETSRIDKSGEEKADWWLPGTMRRERGAEKLLNGEGVLVKDEENVLELDRGYRPRWWLHSIMNVQKNSTELFTFNG